MNADGDADGGAGELRGESVLQFSSGETGGSEGKKCGAAAGEVNGLGDDGGGMLAQLGKPGGDGEGGGFEIVEEKGVELIGGGSGEGGPRGGGEILVLVPGIEGLVNIFGGKAAVREDEDGEERMGGEEGRHDFAAAGAEAGLGGDEEGDIAADVRGDGLELRVGEVELPQFIKGDEDVPGVGAAAAYAAAGGEDFVELDGAGGGDVGGFGEFEGGPADEIFLQIGGNADTAAGDLELQRPAGEEGEGVVPGDGEHPSFEIMKAVGAGGEDAQAEVELGVGADDEAAVVVAGDAGRRGGGRRFEVVHEGRFLEWEEQIRVVRVCGRVYYARLNQTKKRE